MYLYILSYTLKYFYMPQYTSIYIKISNIRKIRADKKHKKGYNSDPRAAPKVQIQLK